MSTIAVARAQNGVAIGSDTLMKIGYTNIGHSYRTNDPKIIEIGASLLGTTGSTAWNQVLSEYFRTLDGEPDLTTVAGIFRTVQALHAALREEFFLSTKNDEDDSFETAGLNLVIANNHGIFGVCPERSVTEYSRFFAIGTGFRYAMGAMHAAYKDADTAGDLVRAGLAAACEFDENSGQPLDIREVSLTPDQ